jgi:hypothetical protein
MSPVDPDDRCDLSVTLGLTLWLSIAWCIGMLYIVARTLRIEGLTPNQTWKRLPALLSRYGYTYFVMLAIIGGTQLACLFWIAYERVSMQKGAQARQQL